MAVLGCTGAIAPELLDLLSKNVGEWGAVDAQQVINVATGRGRSASPWMPELVKLALPVIMIVLINDHEFVVHESAAAAAIGGVIQ